MAQCEICGTEMTQGRGPTRRTCSAACRQAAHRRRQSADVESLRDALRASADQQITTLRDALRADPAAQIRSLREAGEARAHEGVETLKAAVAAQTTGHVETLRHSWQVPRPALPALSGTRTAPPPDDTPAGRIRAAGADLLALVSTAAALAERQWAGAATPEDTAAAVRALADRVVAAVLASTPGTSRSEPDPDATMCDIP